MFITRTAHSGAPIARGTGYNVGRRNCVPKPELVFPNRGDADPLGDDEFCASLAIGTTKPTGSADNNTYHP